MNLRVWLAQRMLSATMFGVKELDGARETMIDSSLKNVLLAYRFAHCKKNYDRLWAAIRPHLDLMSSQVSGSQLVTLEKLARSAAKPGMKILEIGSWLGCSTQVLAKVATENQGSVYCIDIWGKEKKQSSQRLQRRTDAFDIFALFLENMDRSQYRSVVNPLVMTSAQGLKVLNDGAFDFVFIDGDHHYQQTVMDIRGAYPKVAEGGVLSGHDCECRYEDLPPSFVEENCHRDYVRGDIYKGNGVHCGVIKAVHDCLQDYRIDNGIWHLRKASGDSLRPGLEDGHLAGSSTGKDA